MFKPLIVVTLVLIATVSLAKDKSTRIPRPVKVDKEIICFPIKTLLKDLKNKYGEEPMVVGKNGTMEDVVTAVYVNKETGTYTIIEMDEEAGCVLSTGTEVRYRFPKFGSDVL